MNVLQEVKNKRKSLGYTQDEIAKELGVTYQYYNMLENSKRQPSVAVAKKIGDTLNLDWTIFFRQ